MATTIRTWRVVVPTHSPGVVWVATGDLDGDGDLDLVAANRVTRRVDRLFNDGAGHFSGLASTRIPGELAKVWLADLDRDGRLDVLTANPPQYALVFPARSPVQEFTMLGTGRGGFAAPIPAHLRGLIAMGHFSGPGSFDAFVFDSIGVGIAADLHDGTFAPTVVTPGVASCSNGA